MPSFSALLTRLEEEVGKNAFRAMKLCLDRNPSLTFKIHGVHQVSRYAVYVVARDRSIRWRSCIRIYTSTSTRRATLTLTDIFVHIYIYI